MAIHQHLSQNSNSRTWEIDDLRVARSLVQMHELCFHFGMGKLGEFWDKANRKLVGDEKMDQLNAKAEAQNKKVDAWIDKSTAKLEAKIIGSNEVTAKLYAKKKK